MRVLVTGARGFIGRATIDYLCQQGHSVIATTRQAVPERDHQVSEQKVLWKQIKSLNSPQSFVHILDKVEAVIHLAAQAHLAGRRRQQRANDIYLANAMATVSLARHCATRGVGSFIFLSTIGVNGNCTETKPFTEDDPPNPHNMYAQSKHLAEVGLRSALPRSSMKVVTVRAPLVYGPNAPGSFASLVRLVRSGLPIPLGGVVNSRSLLGIDNLCHFIGGTLEKIDHLKSYELFLVSDGEDASTPLILARLSNALGVKARLVRVHPQVLRFAGIFPGLSRLSTSLTRSLVVDIRRAQTVLNWSPPWSMSEQFARLSP